MKEKNILLFIIFVYVSLPLSAQWVWNPEEGWVNAEYTDTTNKNLSKTLANGKRLLEEGKVEKAAESFGVIQRLYPDSKEGKEAALLLGDIEYTAGNYYSAYIYYKKYLDKEPSSEKLQDIIAKEYECGRNIISKKDKEDEDTVLREKGVDILREVIALSKHANFADDAQMLIANYYYDTGAYTEARDEYKKLIKDYPKSEWAPSAQYLLSDCYEKSYRGEEHEMKPLISAQDEIEHYIDLHPEHKYMDKAEKKQREIQEKIALKDISIAEFYIQREKYHSARIYLQYVIKKYPKTRASQKAKLLLKDLPKSSN